MTRIILLFCSAFFMASCSGPCSGKDLFGADEFVMDSYKIREGKFSILELEGRPVQENDLSDEVEKVKGDVFFIGLAEKPSVSVDGKMRLYEVLSKARISPRANLFKSSVVRDGKALPVDFRKLIQEGDLEQNIVMRGGDQVYIAEAESAFLMVMGEVKEQKTIALPNGFMSLKSALAEAGGIRYTGDKSYIQVIRGEMPSPKIYTLNWEHVIHLPNESLLLMPGDIVYVAAKPITEWNRFISQLLPSFIIGPAN